MKKEFKEDLEKLIEVAGTFNGLVSSLDSREEEGEGVELCMGVTPLKIHIYSGIETLAREYNSNIVSELVTYADRTSATRKSINVFGVELFELYTEDKED